MRFDVLTLFPDVIQPYISSSILGRAAAKGALEVHLHNIRDAAVGNHKSVDDTPYGGGAGMVLKVDVLAAALESVEAQIGHFPTDKRCIILLTPQGKRFTQPIARSLAENYEQITFICGHYEGFDERIRSLVDAQISIGDFVLTGGELPAAMIIDAVARLLPSVIHEEGPDEESFSLIDEAGQPLLEYPHYTRPFDYKGQTVPEVLLSGNHAAIKAWRLEQAKIRTAKAKEDHEAF